MLGDLPEGLFRRGLGCASLDGFPASLLVTIQVKLDSSLIFFYYEVRDEFCWANVEQKA